MFPNLRLMLAAIAAAVVALTCGFALFATFRVNHDPLARLSGAGAPLRLLAGTGAPFALPPAPLPEHLAPISGEPRAAAAVSALGYSAAPPLDDPPEQAIEQ